MKKEGGKTKLRRNNMARVGTPLETKKKVKRKLLWTSLLLIFAGSLIASKIDSLYATIGGAAIAVLGCYLNEKSIEWETGLWPES